MFNKGALQELSMHHLLPVIDQGHTQWHMAAGVGSEWHLMGVFCVAVLRTLVSILPVECMQLMSEVGWVHSWATWEEDKWEAVPSLQASSG
jgi:hypothetical protein